MSNNTLSKASSPLVETINTSQWDLSSFNDLDSSKDRIIFRLINRYQNQNLLEETPHIDFLDLAIVFLYLIETHDSVSATILIKNNHSKIWKTDCSSLMSIASNNTPRLLPWSVSNLKDMLLSMEYTDDDLIPEAKDISCPMYILTNSARLHGAGCILYPDVTEELWKRFGCDYYIIPSSIHELLLIPCYDSNTFAAQELNNMIKTVNQTQLDPGEILSDHAYIYKHSMHMISGLHG